MAESKETLSDVIRLLVGDLNEGEIMNESMMQEDSSADSLREKRLTSEGDRTPVNGDYVSRFNPECTGKYSLHSNFYSHRKTTIGR